MRFQFLRYPNTIGLGIYIRAYGKGTAWRTRYIFLGGNWRKPIGFVGWGA